MAADFCSLVEWLVVSPIGLGRGPGRGKRSWRVSLFRGDAIAITVRLHSVSKNQPPIYFPAPLIPGFLEQPGGLVLVSCSLLLSHQPVIDAGYFQVIKEKLMCNLSVAKQSRKYICRSDSNDGVAIMNQWVMRILLTCACQFALTGQAKADLYADAYRAETAGDYAKTAKLCKPLAAQCDARALDYLLRAAKHGDSFASESLGAMYADGICFPKDHKRAEKWYRLAAEKGVTSSQGKLGAMYASGQGVPQDYVLSYMWLKIASANAGGEERATFVGSRDSVALQMTAKQISKANELARKCTSSKFKKCSGWGEPPSKAKATVITNAKRPDPDVSTKTPSALQGRDDHSDLRFCLNPQSNEAIAKCADESTSRKKA